jgi:diaminopimelate decarboxylase
MNVIKKLQHTPHTKRIQKALVRSGVAARRLAKMYGTPLYVWENGKVVAKKP